MIKAENKRLDSLLALTHSSHTPRVPNKTIRTTHQESRRIATTHSIQSSHTAKSAHSTQCSISIHAAISCCHGTDHSATISTTTETTTTTQSSHGLLNPKSVISSSRSKSSTTSTSSAGQHHGHGEGLHDILQLLLRAGEVAVLKCVLEVIVDPPDFFVVGSTAAVGRRIHAAQSIHVPGVDHCHCVGLWGYGVVLFLFSFSFRLL